MSGRSAATNQTISQSPSSKPKSAPECNIEKQAKVARKFSDHRRWSLWHCFAAKSPKPSSGVQWIGLAEKNPNRAGRVCAKRGARFVTQSHVELLRGRKSRRHHPTDEHLHVETSWRQPRRHSVGSKSRSRRPRAMARVLQDFPIFFFKRTPRSTRWSAITTDDFRRIWRDGEREEGALGALGDVKRRDPRAQS